MIMIIERVIAAAIAGRVIIKTIDDRGWYIASTISPVYYLNKDGGFKYGVGDGFWSTEKKALAFYGAWRMSMMRDM
jgi:hypothetical protein